MNQQRITDKVEILIFKTRDKVYNRVDRSVKQKRWNCR